jgi:hypothetical protein
MTGRLTCHKQANRIRTSVEHLMRLAGRDFEPRTYGKDTAVLLYFDGQLSLKNVEELSGMNMEVTNFTGAGRHEFFDDAEVWCPDEMPSVAGVPVGTAPFVMCSGLPTEDRCHRGYSALS